MISAKTVLKETKKANASIDKNRLKTNSNLQKEFSLIEKEIKQAMKKGRYYIKHYFTVKFTDEEITTFNNTFWNNGFDLHYNQLSWKHPLGSVDIDWRRA